MNEMKSLTKNLKDLGKTFNVLKSNGKQTKPMNIKVEGAKNKETRLKMLSEWYQQHEARPRNINKRNFNTEDYTIIEKIKKDIQGLQYLPDGDIIIRKAYNDAISAIQPLLKSSLHQSPNEVKQHAKQLIPYLYTIFTIIQLNKKNNLIPNFQEKFNVIKGEQYNVQMRARNNLNITSKKGPRKIYKNNINNINYGDVDFIDNVDTNTNNRILKCKSYQDEKLQIIHNMFSKCPYEILKNIPCDDIKLYGDFLVEKCS